MSASAFPIAPPTIAAAVGPFPPEATYKASASMDSTISAAMSRRIIADSHFWVRSKLSRRGVATHLRMAAHASTMRKIVASMSRYIAAMLTPVSVRIVSENCAHAASPKMNTT